MRQRLAIAMLTLGIAVVGVFAVQAAASASTGHTVVAIRKDCTPHCP
jgi:hypothetical protein